MQARPLKVYFACLSFAFDHFGSGSIPCSLPPFSACAAGPHCSRGEPCKTTTSEQLDLSWFFDWTSGDVNQVDRPFPITAQCETLHVKSKQIGANGPDAFGPFYVQVYSSFANSVLVVQTQNGLETNLTIPFDVGTGYVICMFDSHGNTGGCQDLFTVYTAPNNTATPGSAACPQLTFPTNNLNVSITNGYNGSPLSSHAWVEQCSDIVLTPKSGTPPFIFTVATPLQPPRNITLHTMDPVVWTVDKAWGQPFFLSMVDSKGISWATGPFHGGGPGSTECFAANLIKTTKKRYTAGIVGSIFGGLVLGALLFFGFELLYRRYTRHKRLDAQSRCHQTGQRQEFPPTLTTPAPVSTTISSSNSTPVTGSTISSSTGAFSARQVDPFLDHSPSASSALTPRKNSLPSSPHSNESQPESVTLGRSASAGATGSRAEGGSGQQVFLIHADGGSVIELPPTYTTAGPSRSSASVNRTRTL